MLDCIMALYFNPTAKVMVKSATYWTPSQSEMKQHRNAPFSLSLEPFLRCIRTNPNIERYTPWRRENSWHLWTKSCYFSQAHASLLTIIEELNNFKEISNLTINYSKSSALNIKVYQKQWSTSVNPITPLFGRNAPQTYLGIQIQIYTLWIINHYCRTWEKMSCYGPNQTFLGTIKMSELPKFLYVM